MEDGYKIYLDGVAWIHQYEPYIPDKNLSYEENAIKQIEEIVAMHENALKEEQAKLEAEQEKAQLLEQVKLQDEAINELASLVSELMMKGAE